MEYLMFILMLSGACFGIAFVAAVIMGILINYFGEDYDMEHDRDGRNKNSREQKNSRW